MAGLRLYLLGPPRLESDDVPVGINRRKAMALLCYLATSGDSHSRDKLATLFWPDASQRQALQRWPCTVMMCFQNPWQPALERQLDGCAVLIEVLRLQEIAIGWEFVLVGKARARVGSQHDCPDTARQRVCTDDIQDAQAARDRHMHVEQHQARHSRRAMCELAQCEKVSQRRVAILES